MINEALQSEYFLNWLQSSTRLLHYGTIRGMEKREPPPPTRGHLASGNLAARQAARSLAAFTVSVWGA